MNDPDAADYLEIFARECRARGIEPKRDAVSHIYATYYDGQGIPVRACHPRDILDKIVEASRWQGRPPELTPEALDIVCRSYFIAGE